MKAKRKTVVRAASRRKPKRSVRSRNGFSSEEFRYLVEHCAELEQYRGEWLLLDGYGLAAHSADFETIKSVISQRGIRSPFIHYVPVEDESNYVNV